MLLTSSLKSFTVGHTIVISRGLLDVLPDEGSLAMVLAHELGHIVLGHGLNTKYAFDDRMMFPDERSFRRLNLHRDEKEEVAADQKGMSLLANSRYEDQLNGAAIFLRALTSKSKDVPHLISPHLGNDLANEAGVRMAPLMDPKTSDGKNTLAAMPLGGRIKVDPMERSHSVGETCSGA
ncbi:MAG: peptidase Ste24p [Acidobacteriaceae bacterium]|nr:peptidase Ste24p [Acidobacteriaceae bacterium]